MTAFKSRALTSIAAEVVLVCLLGYFVVGQEIFVVRHSSFSYLVLSLTVIAGFNVRLYRGKTEFYYLVLVVTVILALTWFVNHSVSLTLTGLGRFWVIVATVLGTWGILQLKPVRNIPFVGLAVWLVVGASFYVIMVVMDMYLFSLYPAEARGYVQPILLNSAKVGALMGAGIGLGSEVGRLLSPSGIPDTPPSQSTKP